MFGTKLPTSLQGTTYTGGLMHVTDWHATLAALGGATLAPKAPLDGIDMWNALTSGAASPRTEILLNHDPCAGHKSCVGVEWAYRLGDMKMMTGVNNDTWYAVPASRAQVDAATGGVWWPDEVYSKATSASNGR